MKNIRVINKLRETNPERLKKNVTQKLQTIINKTQVGGDAPND